jgi:cell division protein FtsI (penicillin-binding protein 3)
MKAVHPQTHLQSAGREKAAALFFPPAGAGSDPARGRFLFVLACTLLAFAAIAGQLVRLGLKGGGDVKLTLAEPISQSWARPDIIDRRGRILATDVAVHSLYADPYLILDVDEAVEKISAVLPELDEAELRRTLSDRSRRFAWLRRGLSPRQAQRVHELGLPGIGFRTELKRAYPSGALAGHVVGIVNIDNKGLSGIERALDEMRRAEPVQGPARTAKAPVRLSLDLGVQHALAEELKAASVRHSTAAAAGLVMDISSGEILAAVSLPEADPERPADLAVAGRMDRLTAVTYELGSIFKILTVAMALENGTATLDKVYDVREPLSVGAYTIKDPSPQARPLTVREIFLHSSNVGAGLLALEVGAERQQAFLARLGLMQQMRTEVGALAAPLLPKHWGKAETITVAYGHGLAVAPLQFAAAVATVITGARVTPTYLASAAAKDPARERIVAQETSTRLCEILRLNVTHAAGTGRRAEAEGYRVGGKTGTAELPGPGGYQERAVISSFLGLFPTDAPQYLTLVLLFEPQPAQGAREPVTAALTAAPATARLIERIAPLLGVLPRRIERKAQLQAGAFDAPRPAQ